MHAGRTFRALLAVAALAGAVPGAASVSAAGKAAPVLRLHPHQADDCESRWLDVRAGTEPGCFFLFQPASEVFHQLDDPIYADYPALRRTVVLDAGRDVRGVIDVDHMVGRGAGVDTVDVRITAKRKGGGEVVVGTASVSQPASPLGDTPFAFTIDVPAPLHRVALHDLTLRIEIRSLSAPHAGVRHDAGSYLDLPLARTGAA